MGWGGIRDAGRTQLFPPWSFELGEHPIPPSIQRLHTTVDAVGRKNHDFLHYGTVGLLEQAGTCAYPSVSLAVNGVLHA